MLDSPSRVTGMARDDPAERAEYEEPEDRPQVWHGYRMSHSINVAWLGHGVTAAQMLALEDAWDVLVVRDEWREWVRANVIPEQPFFYLAVRDDLSRRALRKTPSGASLQLPAPEFVEAESEGALVDLYVRVIHDIYTRWASGHGRAAPPDLPVPL